MSKEGTPELTKSWVVVDKDGPTDDTNAPNPTTSGVQEVPEPESHVDSDTDSISVISESGCSYKTDEEEYSPVEEAANETFQTEPEILQEESESSEPQEIELPIETKGGEKLLYFATSAVCAIMLLGLSVAVQRYLQNVSNVDSFDEQEVVFSQLKKDPGLKGEPSTKFTHRMIKQVSNKFAKLEEHNLYDAGANHKNKLNHKFPGNCDKDNCEKRRKFHDENPRPDENKKSDDEYDNKIKELKIKEDYLKEKEKFLIEREHALLKKEMKLNKEKQHKNKHDKKFKREKEYDQDSSEEEPEEKHEKPKNREFLNKQFKSKNKKRKYDDKKTFSAEKRKFFTEHDKKRNISGQWYINLHEARDNMRQKKYAYFKRNKAHWYFQWMVDRARLRGK